MFSLLINPSGGGGGGVVSILCIVPAQPRPVVLFLCRVSSVFVLYFLSSRHVSMLVVFVWKHAQVTWIEGA